jgi:hypothetical protein
MIQIYLKIHDTLDDQQHSAFKMQEIIVHILYQLCFIGIKSDRYIIGSLIGGRALFNVDTDF